MATIQGNSLDPGPTIPSHFSQIKVGQADRATCRTVSLQYDN